MAVKNKRKPTSKLGKFRDVTLSGLPGMSAKSVKAARVASVIEAMRFVRAGYAVTAAGDTGALSVWRDDEGSLRADFQRYMIIRSRVTTDKLCEVSAWLKAWWPRLGR